MFFTFYNYLKLIIWGSIYFFDYKIYKESNDILLNILINNIQNTNPLFIKCIQKSIPYLKLCNVDNNTIKILNKVYENNKYHDIDFTLKVYKKDLNKNLNDNYEICELLSSGSIGQVYKIKSKKENKFFAMKVIHPNVNYHIKILKSLYYLFNLEKYCPFELDVFLDNFILETNFENEARNMLKFYNLYENNKSLIIPKLYEYSKNIIIMDYIDGLNIENLDDYEKNKYMTIFILFCNNNKLLLNYNHGDMHIGNFKKYKDSLVIYDFGCCFESDDKKLPEMIDYTFHNILKKKDLTYSFEHCINYQIEYHVGKENLPKYKKNINDTFFSCKIPDNMELLINKVIMFFYKNKIKIKINFLNLMINYYYTLEYNDVTTLDMISFCKTYDIFHDYVKYILKGGIILYRESEKFENYNKELADKFKKMI